MAKIVIDPEVDDYEHAIELIDVLYGVNGADEDELDSTSDDDEDEAVAESGPAKTSTPIEGFTPARMKRYVQNLTIAGHKALRYMAQHAPQVEMDDVQQHLAIEPRVYAGTMSTFGHAVRATKGVQRMPFERHYRVYSIDPRVAKMALSALDTLGL